MSSLFTARVNVKQALNWVAECRDLSFTLCFGAFPQHGLEGIDPLIRAYDGGDFIIGTCSQFRALFKLTIFKAMKSRPMNWASRRTVMHRPKHGAGKADRCPWRCPGRSAALEFKEGPRLRLTMASMCRPIRSRSWSTRASKRRSLRTTSPPTMYPSRPLAALRNPSRCAGRRLKTAENVSTCHSRSGVFL